MTAYKDILAAAAKLENENLRFRTFLKAHADPDELDRQFLALHTELFAGYDCCQCGNCCRKYSTTLSEMEIASISAYLSMTRQQFLEAYLIRGRDGRELPASCRLLDTDDRCRIQACKPEECKGFPYTNHPDRLASTYSVLSAAEVCSVVFEILERLKKCITSERAKNKGAALRRAPPDHGTLHLLRIPRVEPVSGLLLHPPARDIRTQ